MHDALLAQHAQALSPWLMVAAVGAVVLIVLLLMAPLLRRRGESRASPSSPSSATSSSSDPSAQRAVERDIRSLMQEVTEMTRRAGAQLDQRAARLEQLIREADQRLARLAAMPPSQSSSTGDGATSAPSADEGTPPAASSDDIDPRHVEIYTLCEQGLSIPQIADRLRRPSGEVELILALRPRNHSMSSSRD